jgi:hypothetical protein
MLGAQVTRRKGETKTIRRYKCRVRMQLASHVGQVKPAKQ